MVIRLFGVILHTSDDVMIFIAHDGLTTVTEVCSICWCRELELHVVWLQAFGMLQQMYHEATACNVVAELLDLLNMVARLLKVVRRIEQTNTQGALVLGMKFLVNFCNVLSAAYCRNAISTRKMGKANAACSLAA